MANFGHATPSRAGSRAAMGASGGASGKKAKTAFKKAAKSVSRNLGMVGEIKKQTLPAGLTLQEFLVMCPRKPDARPFKEAASPILTEEARRCYTQLLASQAAHLVPPPRYMPSEEDITYELERTRLERVLSSRIAEAELNATETDLQNRERRLRELSSLGRGHLSMLERDDPPREVGATAHDFGQLPPSPRPRGLAAPLTDSLFSDHGGALGGTATSFSAALSPPRPRKKKRSPSRGGTVAVAVSRSTPELGAERYGSRMFSPSPGKSRTRGGMHSRTGHRAQVSVTSGGSASLSPVRPRRALSPLPRGHLVYDIGGAGISALSTRQPRFWAANDDGWWPYQNVGEGQGPQQCPILSRNQGGKSPPRRRELRSSSPQMRLRRLTVTPKP